MKDVSDKEFYNTVWIDYHRKALECCRQLIKEDRLEPARVILDLMDKNLKTFD